MAVTFEQAREAVLTKVSGNLPPPPVEDMSLLDATGRVLAEPAIADRDYPPLDRSVRDGFALRSVDTPGNFWIIGEVRAGERFTDECGPGQAVEIMTGAPMPAGADCVVMVEHVSYEGETVRVSTKIEEGANVNERGSEAMLGEMVLKPGTRLGFAEAAVLATFGHTRVRVFQRPKVAILATGDELVDLDAAPLPHQIRNSNSYSLAAQVARAGGDPAILPIARDRAETTRASIESALAYDLLLLSGGVSAGKYDVVERALADLGAEFYFDRVLIQPGQPLVFGRVRERFFFGLPGNPASTMVTFEIFARAALELLSGLSEPVLPLTWTRLAADFRQKPGLTRFLPAQLSPDGSELTPVGWSGSGDVAAVARANAFLVTEPNRTSWSKGDLIRVLLQ